MIWWPALAVLALALVNLWRVPRLRGGRVDRKVSALVPARDEEAGIAACVRALLAEPVHEVIVYDDGSRDRTAQIVAGIVDPRLRLLRGGALPEGWAGKPHACARLAEAASGDVLLFVDADVLVEPGALAALCARDEDFVTAVPRQITLTFGERLVVPLLHVVYYALAPLFWLPFTRDARFAAANGQLIAVRAEAYRRLGGHAAVRGALVEDVELCRAALRAGLRVLFADGQAIARCRMYTSFTEVRRGFAKNLYPGVGGTMPRLLVALLLLALTLLFPLATLPGLCCVAGLRLVLALRFRQSLLGALLHPLALLALFGIAVESAVRAHRGGLEWRGRRYGLRGAA